MLCFQEGEDSRKLSLFRFRGFDDGFLSTSPDNSLRKYEKRVASFNQMASRNGGQVMSD